MEMTKKEKTFRNIISNVLIFGMIFVVVITCFVMSFNSKTALASNSEYNGTIYAGDKTSKNVSLMINVYWGNESLEEMLKIFEKHNIKTTFFVGGSWAIKNQELLKKIHSLGHEIASHGYSHKEHAKLSYNDNIIEIQKCHNIVKEILDVDMELFAPPGGSYNSNTIKAANELGYKTIMWTRDTIDWRDKNTELIYSRAVSKMSGGDLILMHPTPCTKDALEKVIDYAKSNNFNLTTVSETLGL